MATIVLIIISYYLEYNEIILKEKGNMASRRHRDGTEIDNVNNDE